MIAADLAVAAIGRQRESDGEAAGIPSARLYPMKMAWKSVQLPAAGVAGVVDIAVAPAFAVRAKEKDGKFRDDGSISELENRARV